MNQSINHDWHEDMNRANCGRFHYSIVLIMKKLEYQFIKKPEHKQPDLHLVRVNERKDIASK